MSAVLLVALVLSGCAAAPGTGIKVAGDTRVDVVTVSAPRLSNPAVDVTLGIAKSQTPTATAARKKAADAAAAGAPKGPAVAGYLALVKVRAGDTVKKGQVLAVFDDRMLQLGVQNAEAARLRAIAQADTLKANADTLRDTRETARAAGRKGLATGAAALAKVVADMKAGLAGARIAIPRLEAWRAHLQAQLAQAELDAASPTPPPGIQDKIRSLKKQLADNAILLGKARGAVATLPTAIPKAQAAGAAQLAAGRAKLASALAKITDGITKLENASDVVRIGASAKATGVDIARSALDQATLRSPVDGVVLSAMPSGQVAMVGAPVVVIRPAGATLVDAYVSPDLIGRVKPGDTADVTFDSVHGALSGKVTRVWPGEVFPPTNYPTQIVHLSRVVRVTVSLPAEDLPLGVPADVVIHPSS